MIFFWGGGEITQTPRTDLGLGSSPTRPQTGGSARSPSLNKIIIRFQEMLKKAEEQNNHANLDEWKHGILK